MTIDLTDIIRIAITMIAALVTYKLIPWIKARTTEAQQTNIRAFVKVLVFAAEQLYGAGHGHEKFEYVRQKLHEYGFDVDVAEIEAVVAEYLNYWKIAPVVTIEDVDEDAEGDEKQPPSND